MFFLPYLDRPRSSCPSTQRLLGNFFSAASGSWVFAHSSLQRTRNSFSAVETHHNKGKFQILFTHLSYRWKKSKDKKWITSGSRFKNQIHHLVPVIFQNSSETGNKKGEQNDAKLYFKPSYQRLSDPFTCRLVAWAQLWCQSAAFHSNWWSLSAWGTS